MQRYDIIIPLGENCITAGNLRSNKLQYESFQFDWIVMAMDTGLKLLRSRCANFINLQNLQFKDSNPDHDRYLDTVSQLEFVHDFKCGENPADRFEAIKAKYQRRIERFYNRIEHSKSVLFVCTFYKRDKSSDQQIQEYFLDLNTIFPNQKVGFCAIELFEGKADYSEKIINEDIRKFTIHTPDVFNWNPLKQIYTNIYSHYGLTFWRKMEYFWPDLWFRFKKTGLKILASLMPIPSLRKSLKQKTKRKFFE